MKRPKFTPTNFIIAICIISLILLFIPFIRTIIFIIQEYEVYNLEYTQTEHIGNIIGGFTTPIVGLISIWLLYKTFREQRRFNEKQLDFNKQEISFETAQEKINQQQIQLNQKQVELYRKQLRIDNYNLFINLHNLLYEEIDAIVVTYTNNKQSIGFDVFIELNKQFPISCDEFNKLIIQVDKLHHLIEKLLKINHKSDVVYINRKIFYESTGKYIDKICSYCDYLLGGELKIEFNPNDLFDKEKIDKLKEQIKTLKRKLLVLKQEYKPKPRKKQTSASIEPSTLTSTLFTQKK